LTLSGLVALGPVRPALNAASMSIHAIDPVNQKTSFD